LKKSKQGLLKLRPRSYPLLPNLKKLDFEKIKKFPEDKRDAMVKDIEEMLRLKEELPHLYGYPFYTWALDFFESQNKENFLCSANQISKSSTLIRRFVHWATGVHWDKNFWKERWPSLRPGQVPNQFWYFYPNLDVATIEFETKWEPEFLPRGSMKTHPIFGWEPMWDSRKIKGIKFNSGVTIYFKGYSQKVADIQTGTVYMVGCDEELPVNLLSEIQARLNATDGYFHMVFTATLGQLHWEQTIEPKNSLEEKHPSALKLQVGLYDAMFYEDGSPSPWTEDKIKRAIARCATQAEIQRRVFGKFVKTEGLRYESFDRTRNMAQAQPIPTNWSIYAAVDPGSGGKSGHPSAIVFLGVSPDHKHGRVFRAWRGDGIPTASSDTLKKYRELRGNLKPVAQKYDHGAKEFFMIATNQGEAFSPANKERVAGISLLNTLFKTGMLKLQAEESEVEKLVSELCSIPVETDKSHSLDDLSDALRYAAMAVPWDFSDIKLSDDEEAMREPTSPRAKTSTEERREWFMGGSQVQGEETVEEELDYWAELLES
jgi:phage terminase large subunit-like protein